MRAAGPRRWAVLLVAGLLLTGCTSEQTGDEDGRDAAEDGAQGVVAATEESAPTLEHLWQVPGFNANPDAVGQHHWMTYQSTTSGVGRGLTSHPGPVLLVDTRTGRARPRTPEPERWPCALPDPISDSGVVPILWAGVTMTPGHSPDQSEPCRTMTAMDASSGKVLWRDTLDLAGLSHQKGVAADDRVVAVVDQRGRRACFDARDGSPVAGTDASCRALAERLTHADLPRLTAPDGSRVRLGFGSERSELRPFELGRTDEVLLLREDVLEWTDDRQGYRNTGRLRVRAHDLTTGETLWEDELDPDPHEDDAWSRHETYAVTPSGVMRISYEHPEDGDDLARTPMVLEAVDARTGEAQQVVGRVDGAWFHHQFGDVLVALTHQQLGLRSRITGYRLPAW